MLVSFLVCYVILEGTFAQESCTDNPPNSAYTCQQQKDWGKCNFDWMVQGNFCAETCGRCTDTGNIDDFWCGLEDYCIYGLDYCDTIRCADGDCNARQSNIQGELVLLDVNSQFYQGGPSKPPEVTNPADCCDQCKQTSGCNAWVFCSNENGCGSGCQKYIDSLNLNLPEDFGNPLGFGFYGPRCRGEKWPRLMCSLKTVSDVNNPEEAGAEDGWVSGVLYTP